MKAKINKNEEIIFYPNIENPLKGKSFDVDVLEKYDNNIRVCYKNKKYIARLLKIDIKNKNIVLKINGNKFTVDLEDNYDKLLKSMGMGAGTKQKINNLKAPMPGVVFDINIKEGDNVKKDDSLIILEAMKMENVLKSPIDGKVKKVLVSKGETVEKNKVLIEFE